MRNARALALTFALLAALVPLHADDDPAPPQAAPAVTDPTLVAQHYRQVAARPEFVDAEDTGVNPQLEDLLSEWFQNLGKKIGDFKYASRMPAFESLLMSVLVALSLTIVIYVVVRLTRGHPWTWREAEAPAADEKTLRAPETYDQEITHAVSARDWHAAWLASWRQFLSRLERRSLVEADRTRTNREYLGQLRGQPLPATALTLLTAMVDAYDRSIYGRAAIGEADWNDFHQQIEEAALLLHLDDKRAPEPVTAP
ncbi:MAG TPA: DUF4129 domain-containing protein [Candidatus Methylacidiphilales bacterium]|nr:DUF4129 domain-containing protein [Candidatus Methylacidiphilales bacterium]